MTTDELKSKVAQIKWWHTIDLGGGVVTPGLDDSPAKLKKIGMPEVLRGKSVLDIGAWDGYFSFEAERHGASRVMAVDSFCWNGAGWGEKAGFELARQALGSKVEDFECEVLDLSPEKIGVWDLVLYLGVLYHMRHPLLALERVSSVTKEQLILETEVDMLFSGRPAMAFYPGLELSNDPTNWWGPNQSLVEAMLKDVGFRKVRIHAKDSFAHRVGRAIKHRLTYSTPVWWTLQRSRMVFHAWK